MRAYCIRFLFAALLTISATLLLVRRIDEPVIGIDDANIFFSYARNLSEGRGCVYSNNSEHVEGFSSLLWMLICSAAFKCSSNPEFVLLGISLVLTSAALANASQLLPTMADSGSTTRQRLAMIGLYLSIVFTNMGYCGWMTVTLMDTCLWSFWLTTGTVCLASDRRNSIVLAACIVGALLSRPEAMLVTTCWIMAMILNDLMAGCSVRTVVSRAALFVLVVGGTAATLTASRLLYFGYPFPNTYYAKVSASLQYNLYEGILYLYGFLRATPVACAVMLVAIPSFVVEVVSAFRRQMLHPDSPPAKQLRTDLMLACGICSGILPSILVGGDHFVWFRFFQPVWPLIVVFGLRRVAAVWMQLSDDVRSMAAPGFVRTLVLCGGTVFGIAITCNPSWVEPDVALTFEISIARQGRELGEQLNRIFESQQKPRVGIITAGGIAMTYQGRIDDLLGLNDVRMGHSAGLRFGLKNHAAFSRDVFYEILPEVIVQCDVPDEETGMASGFVNNIFNGLFDEEEFRAKYTPLLFKEVGDREAFEKGDFGETDRWWVRNDYLPMIRGLGTILIREIEEFAGNPRDLNEKGSQKRASL